MIKLYTLNEDALTQLELEDLNAKQKQIIDLLNQLIVMLDSTATSSYTDLSLKALSGQLKKEDVSNFTLCLDDTAAELSEMYRVIMDMFDNLLK